MHNPLESRCTPQETRGPTLTADQICQSRNQAMFNSHQGRQDIEWVVDGNGGLHLQTKRAVLEARVKADAENREIERQRFNHRQRHPIASEAA